MSYAVNQRFRCAYKTLLLSIAYHNFSVHCSFYYEPVNHKIKKKSQALTYIVCIKKDKFGKASQAHHRRYAIFCSCLEKKLFYSHWITFFKCLKPFERTMILNILKPIEKNKIFQSSFHVQFQSKIRLKSCIVVSNFVSDLAQVGGNKMHCFQQYFSCK